MKIRFTAILCGLLILGGCSPSGKKNEKIERQRLGFEAEMADSLRLYQSRLDSLQTALPVMMAEVDSMLHNFDRVDNPREVEGYYILRASRKDYPLDRTGVTARITDNETLEIIAALKGGFFDRIEVSDGSSSATSAVVPNDQALNYRIGNFTTVAFTGPEADNLARLIAEAQQTPVVNFLNPSRTGSLKLSAQDRETIARTYSLYAKRRKINAAEREVPLLSRKCEILKARNVEKNEQTASPKR